MKGAPIRFSVGYRIDAITARINVVLYLLWWIILISQIDTEIWNLEIELQRPFGSVFVKYFGNHKTLVHTCFHFSSRFDPDRFNSDNLKQLPNLSYQPFGFAGKRKCPGWRLSIAEGLVFLSVLVKRFKFHLVEGQHVKPVYRLVTSPSEEIWVTVTKR